MLAHDGEDRPCSGGVRETFSEAWCNCQGDGSGPWHPLGDTPYCPPMCERFGPRIGDDAPRCINPRGHLGNHLAHSSWHRSIKSWR